MNARKGVIEWLEDNINEDKQRGLTDTVIMYQNTLNLIKKQQAEIETLKRDFEIVDHECSRLEQEDIKKDKLINLMAEQLTTPLHSKEWVIDYYKREIEK